MMGGRQAEVVLQVTLVRAEHMGKRNETCEYSKLKHNGSTCR